MNTTRLDEIRDLIFALQTQFDDFVVFICDYITGELRTFSLRKLIPELDWGDK